MAAPYSKYSAVVNKGVHGGQSMRDKITPLPQPIKDPVPGKKQPGGGASENRSGMKYWMQQMEAPITADIGLSEQERQSIYNLARRQNQSATNAAAEEMLGAMGGRGFRAGDSGIADTAIGKIYGEGAERLGQVGTQTAIEEAKDRFAQNAQLANLNLQRLQGGGSLAAQLKQAQLAGAQLGLSRDQMEQQQRQWEDELGLKRDQFGFDKTKWADEYGLANQQFGLSESQFKDAKERGLMDDLMRWITSMRGSEGEAWGDYNRGHTSANG